MLVQVVLAIDCHYCHSVDLLAALYPPVYNELRDDLKPCTFDFEECDADIIKSHRQFLKLQLYYYCHVLQNLLAKVTALQRDRLCVS